MEVRKTRKSEPGVKSSEAVTLQFLGASGTVSDGPAVARPAPDGGRMPHPHPHRAVGARAPGGVRARLRRLRSTHRLSLSPRLRDGADQEVTPPSAIPG